MTRCLFLATLATLVGAIAALFWAFVKVGGDFRERPLRNVEPDEEWLRIFHDVAAFDRAQAIQSRTVADEEAGR